jgi:DUF971 family protein
VKSQVQAATEALKTQKLSFGLLRMWRPCKKVVANFSSRGRTLAGAKEVRVRAARSAALWKRMRRKRSAKAAPKT